MTDEMILVPRYELLAWAEEWLYENDPGDGTDCVTPFDTYLLKSPVVVQTAAVDDLNDWRAAFIAERSTRYRESGMSIEQARIYAETDAACIDADALAADQGGAE